MSKKRIPYNERDDLEKLQSQWNKIKGIFDRGQEWSAAIVRAATAVEIAANIAIRKRFEKESDFQEDFVDSLLLWANGLDGKFRRLIIATETYPKRIKDLKNLKKQAEKLNHKRNDIVHRGAFASEKVARDLVDVSRTLIEELVSQWESDFSISDPNERKSRGRKLSKK